MSLHHLALAADWEAAAATGEYRTSTLGRTLEEEGFIHLSRPEQVAATADRFYRGRSDVVLLDVDPALVGAPVVEDPVGDDRYPHLYGPLPVAAVTRVGPLPPGPDGRLTLPPGLR